MASLIYIRCEPFLYILISKNLYIFQFEEGKVRPSPMKRRSMDTNDHPEEVEDEEERGNWSKLS